jgi:hypothetical protein
MPTNTSKPLDPELLQDDKDAVTAILAIGNYQPANSAFAKAVVYQKTNNVETGLKPQLAAAEEDLVLKEAAFRAARDKVTALSWEHHAWVLGARDQVKAQFGDNSDEYASTGRKKKAEYKKRSTKAAPKSAQT